MTLFEEKSHFGRPFSRNIVHHVCSGAEEGGIQRCGNSPIDRVESGPSFRDSSSRPMTLGGVLRSGYAYMGRKFDLIASET